jgi:lipid-binding SYLF domain-containing protein
MMKKNLLILILGFVLLPVCSLAKDNPDQYTRTIKLFRDSPVSGKFFKNSYGYAVMPVVGKGGIVIGASFGKGKVYRGGKVRGMVSMAKVSLGFQLGGQAFSEIIFFQDKRAYEEFIRGTFEFDATASAVAITAAAQARAGTAGKTAGVSSGPAKGKQVFGKYVKGMAIFIHVKGGLMYEASIGGQTFTFEKLKP